MLLYNGQLLLDEDFALTLPNRGLFFNDGFFETLVWTDGSIRYLPHHLARMERAAAALGLTLPPELVTAEGLTHMLGKLATGSAHRLRLQLWRSGGGLYAPETTECSWLATTRPFQPNDAPLATTGFAETVQTRLSLVSFCKGPESLTYVLAARERIQRNLDELILLDTAGHVAETVSAAIFWISDNCLFTPALTTGCVAGVRRAHLLQVAKKHGLECQEGLFQPAALLRAETVFTANVAGIRVLSGVGEVRWDTVSPLLFSIRGWEAGQ
ncbi:aminotransferase class IV [Hymenobacter volaticus]|uniref:branched-chain-amino-acid transaminase n=1 Tax=Hymenobacter volaticus TaxID=2932254 RepID=A0ABY4G0L0_9BACT|nr:aminotransferase class IV [Hymenobacter volaticus]UOQ64342.1 aminotransferase class IV [Hymenobacter volaticus]